MSKRSREEAEVQQQDEANVSTVSDGAAPDAKRQQLASTTASSAASSPAASIFDANKSIAENLKLPCAKVSSGELATFEQVSAMLAQLAHYLLNDLVLCLNGTSYYRLAEVEFYFTTTNSNVHKDPFTHMNEYQRECSQWYFHRSGTSKQSSYKSGTYKGLDIAFGSNEIFAGCLIRGLVHVGSNGGSKKKKGSSNNLELVDGPCKVVDHILETVKADTVDSLVSEKFKGVLSVTENSNVMCLKSKKDAPKDQQDALFARDITTVYSSGRVGLTLKKAAGANDELAGRMSDYILLDYRFFCVPQLMKKGKHYMISSLYKQLIRAGTKASEVENKIKEITGSTPAAVKKSVEAFKIGANADSKLEAKQFFGKAMSDEDVCTLAGIVSLKQK